MGGEDGDKIVRVSGDSLTIKISEEEEKYRSKYLPDPKKLTDEKLVCTVCSVSLVNDVHKGKTVYVHRSLKVLVCQACFSFYGDGCFSTDEDGDDKYCRWCGQGGTLYLCSACNCAFCQKCVKQNLKASVLAELENDDWKCYFCIPRPLYGCRTICWGALELNKIGIEKEKEKLKKQKERLEKMEERKKEKEENHKSIKMDTSSEDEQTSKKRKSRVKSSDCSSPEVMPAKKTRSSIGSGHMNGNIDRTRRKRRDSSSNNERTDRKKVTSRSSRSKMTKKYAESSSEDDSDIKSKSKAKLKKKKPKDSSDESPDEDKKKSRRKSNKKRSDSSDDESSDSKPVKKKRFSRKKKDDSDSSSDNKPKKKNLSKKKNDTSSDEMSDDDHKKKLKKVAKKKKHDKSSSEDSDNNSKKDKKKSSGSKKNNKDSDNDLKKGKNDKYMDEKTGEIKSKVNEASGDNAMVKKRIKLAILWLSSSVKDISELGTLISLRATKFGKKKINPENLKTYDDVLNAVSKLKQLISGIHSNYEHIEKSLDAHLKPWKMMTGLEDPEIEKTVAEETVNTIKNEAVEGETATVESSDKSKVDISLNSTNVESNKVKEGQNNETNDMVLQWSGLSADEDSSEEQMATQALISKANETLEKEDKENEEGDKAVKDISSDGVNKTEDAVSNENSPNSSQNPTSQNTTNDDEPSQSLLSTNQAEHDLEEDAEKKPEKSDESVTEPSQEEAQQKESNKSSKEGKKSDDSNSDTDMFESKESSSIEHRIDEDGDHSGKRSITEERKDSPVKKSPGSESKRKSESKQGTVAVQHECLDKKKLQYSSDENLDSFSRKLKDKWQHSKEIMNLKTSLGIDSSGDSDVDFKLNKVEEKKKVLKKESKEDKLKYKNEQCSKKKLADKNKDKEENKKDIQNKLNQSELRTKEEKQKEKIETTSKTKKVREREVKDVSHNKSEKEKEAKKNVLTSDESESDNKINQNKKNNESSLTKTPKKETEGRRKKSKKDRNSSGSEDHEEDKKSNVKEKKNKYTVDEEVEEKIDKKKKSKEAEKSKKEENKTSKSEHSKDSKKSKKEDGDAKKSKKHKADKKERTTNKSDHHSLSNDFEKNKIEKEKQTSLNKFDLGTDSDIDDIAEDNVQDIKTKDSDGKKTRREKEDKKENTTNDKLEIDKKKEKEMKKRDRDAVNEEVEKNVDTKNKSKESEKSKKGEIKKNIKEDIDAKKVKKEKEDKKQNTKNEDLENDKKNKRKEEKKTDAQVEEGEENKDKNTKSKEAEKSKKEENKTIKSKIIDGKKTTKEKEDKVENTTNENLKKDKELEKRETVDADVEENVDRKKKFKASEHSKDSKKEDGDRKKSKKHKVDEKEKTTNESDHHSHRNDLEKKKIEKEKQTSLTKLNLSTDSDIDDIAEDNIQDIKTSEDRKKSEEPIGQHEQDEGNSAKEDSTFIEKVQPENSIEVQEENECDIQNSIEDNMDCSESSIFRRTTFVGLGLSSEEEVCQEDVEKKETQTSDAEEKDTVGTTKTKGKSLKKRSERNQSRSKNLVCLDSSDEEEQAASPQSKGSDKDQKGDKNDSDRSASIIDLSSFESSDSEIITKKKRKKKSSSDSEFLEEENNMNKKKRRRIKMAASSNESDGSDEDNTRVRRKRKSSVGESPGKGLGRKNIKKIKSKDDLEEKTKEAAEEEKERRKRVEERQKLFNQVFEVKEAHVLEKLVLDFDLKEKKELLSVDKSLVAKMKPHQAKGVKFMWDSCFESLAELKKKKGSGCILAHCMGLGKTFQVISLVHTLLSHEEETGVHAVMVVCPLSTVLNWYGEFDKWLQDVEGGNDIEVFHLTKCKQNPERARELRRWQHNGGVLIMGYEMFRNLTAEKNKKFKAKMKKDFLETLIDPGADLIVCDEGHMLKNEQTAISKAMARVKTLRRIVLTGTPMQNNLGEYHCMVQFVKPNLLGTRKEFLNRFVNPMTNGQFVDSTDGDVKVMKRRAHVLHKMLEGLVQRFDYNVLTPFLPPKHEYVVSVCLSELQIKLYQHYLQHYSQQSEHNKGGARLFKDWQALGRIWTHPRVIKMSSDKANLAREKKALEESDTEGSLNDFIDDDDGSDSQTTPDESDNNSSCASVKSVDEKKKSNKTNSRGRISTRSTRSNPKNIALLDSSGDEKEKEEELTEAGNNDGEWWNEFVEPQHMDDINQSGKLVMLFGILKEAEMIEDKVLVFSQSLFSLNLIEYFLDKIDTATQDGRIEENLGNHQGNWAKGLDYFRLDGSSSSEHRSIWCNSFNREDNPRARLFLISTRAGGLGINLTAANRVIIFDASWNPSHDVQSIFRIFRFGQKKPCYVYRFIAHGTMEEKVYDRQVAKQSMSNRVVDEQQVHRHFSSNDLNELYSFTPPTKKEDRPIPSLPKDVLFAEILKQFNDWVEKYHEHDSLLENVVEEELNEEERKLAWEDFENDKKRGFAPAASNTGNVNPLSFQIEYLRSQLKSQYPNKSEQELNQILVYQVSVLMRQQQMASQMQQAQQRPGVSMPMAPMMPFGQMQQRPQKQSQQVLMADYQKQIEQANLARLQQQSNLQNALRAQQLQQQQSVLLRNQLSQASAVNRPEAPGASQATALERMMKSYQASRGKDPADTSKPSKPPT